MPIPTSWERCYSFRPRKPPPDPSGGVHACCVHVGPLQNGPQGPFKGFGCCWCDNALPFPQAAMPPLPEPAGPGAEHGPSLYKQYPVATAPDLKL
jgi:hypothetical protein